MTHFSERRFPTGFSRNLVLYPQRTEVLPSRYTPKYAATFPGHYWYCYATVADSFDCGAGKQARNMARNKLAYTLKGGRA
jgi:hypothetical protein